MEHVAEPQVVEDKSVGAEAGKSSRIADGGDPDDEEDVCRICRTPGDDDSPLYYPCACSGSIKYVHQECLLQWLNHSNARQCEVCYAAASVSILFCSRKLAMIIS